MKLYRWKTGFFLTSYSTVFVSFIYLVCFWINIECYRMLCTVALLNANLCRVEQSRPFPYSLNIHHVNLEWAFSCTPLYYWRFSLHSFRLFSLYIYFFNFNFYFILLYNTVLVLPYIDMNQPQVYMSSQTWTPLPLPSP